MKPGTIHHRDSLFLHRAIGRATQEGIQYEVCTNADGSPLIRCTNTGKWFSLPWVDVVHLAISAGIDQDDRATRTNHGASIAL